jgi:hypothetical protein
MTDRQLAEEAKAYAQAERARMDGLRENLQIIVERARDSKQQGKLDFHKYEHLAVRLMLDYIGSGYITRLWNELQQQRQ